jgi:hypothetical protein
VITLAAAAGLVIAFVTGRIGDPETPAPLDGRSNEDQQRRVATLRWQISLGVVVVGLIALTIAQHASGGGNAHARYAMPAIGVAAVLIVVGMERIWSRWAPLALVAVAGWWALVNLPVDIDPQTLRRNRDDGQLAPFPLRDLPLSDAWRSGAGVLIVIGVIVAAAVLIATAASAGRPTAGADSIDPTTPEPQGGDEFVSASSASDRSS